MQISEIQHIIDEYLELFPEELSKLQELQQRLEIDEVFNNRSSFQGHGTGGAIVLSPDRRKILLIHHKSLNKWLQPGGHWDPEDPSPWAVAQREAEEETGVQIARRILIPGVSADVPIDIDSHHIPARKSRNEPAHTHHDFRYAFLAADEVLTIQKAEIYQASWVLLDADDERLAEVRPSITKLRALKLI